jgi:cytochrome c553
VKTNKYRTFKIINPMMNLVVIGLSDKDVEDISAYYHSLGKPAFVNPRLSISHSPNPE